MVENEEGGGGLERATEMVKMEIKTNGEMYVTKKIVKVKQAAGKRRNDKVKGETR